MPSEAGSCGSLQCCFAWFSTESTPLMLIHPEFDPVALHLGPLAVRWYGLMYLVGFALFWVLGRIRAREAWRGITKENVEDLLFYGV